MYLNSTKVVFLILVLICCTSVRGVMGTVGYGKTILTSLFALKTSLSVYQINVCCIRQNKSSAE